MDVFNLADLWEAVADCVPDRIALCCGEQRRTYAKLEEQSSRLAHWYLEQGVKTGDHIGLYMENCVEYVEATLAAYKVRAVPININYRYTAGELQRLFDDADLVGVVHQWGFSDRVTEVEHQVAQTLRWKLATGSTYTDAVGLVVVGSGLWPLVGGRSLHLVHRRHHGSAQRGGVATGRRLLRLYGGWQSGPSRGGVGRGAARTDRARSEHLSAPRSVDARRRRMGRVAPSLQREQGRIVVGLAQSAQVWRTIEQEKVTATSTVGDAVMRPLLDAWDDFDPKPDIESLAVVSSGGAPLDGAARSVPRHLPFHPTL